MSALQRFPTLAVAVALIAGAAFANTVTPAAGPEPISDAVIPPHCRVWLGIPADSTSATLPWEQRLSLAACRQVIQTHPTSDPAQFADLVAGIDRAMQPSVRIYHDAMTRGVTPQIQMLGAYGLGMAYVDTIVRARSAMRVLDGSATGGAYGGSTYGATLDRYQILSRALEPLLAAYQDAAVGAFNEVGRIATEHPDWARANHVVIYVVADAQRQTDALRPARSEASPRTTAR